MKEYRGMYKEYFELKSNEKAQMLADRLRTGISSVQLANSVGRHSGFIVYCDEMLKELHDIENLNQKIWLLTERLPTVAHHQFLKLALIEEIHQTNEMENIHSTRKEINDELIVIRNGRKGKRFDGMIRKYQLLLSGQSISLRTCQDIRNLYDSFILDEVVKENPSDIPDGLYFRKGPVYIDKKSITVHEGVFPESVLNEAMENALSFLNNNEYNPLIRIAAFHYLFGYIHPFYNGNGRMGRFISSYCLSSVRIHYLVSLRLSYVIKSHRAQYYNMFKTTNDARNYGDLTRFVIEFLSFIREACEQVLRFLKEKSELIAHYDAIIQNTQYDNHSKQLLFILAQVSVCESDSLSLKELAEAGNVSYHVLRKSIGSIEPLLILSRSGNSKCYRADLQKLDQITP